MFDDKNPEIWKKLNHSYVSLLKGIRVSPMFIDEGGEYPHKTTTKKTCLISKKLLIWLGISYATIHIQLLRSMVNILTLLIMSQQNNSMITTPMNISNR